MSTEKLDHLIQVAMERAGSNPHMAQRIISPVESNADVILLADLNLRNPGDKIVQIRWDHHWADHDIEHTFLVHYDADAFIINDLAGAPPRLMRKILSIITERTLQDRAGFRIDLDPAAQIYITDSGDPQTDGYRGLLNKHPRIQTIR